MRGGLPGHPTILAQCLCLIWNENRPILNAAFITRSDMATPPSARRVRRPSVTFNKSSGHTPLTTNRKCTFYDQSAGANLAKTSNFPRMAGVVPIDVKRTVVAAAVLWRAHGGFDDTAQMWRNSMAGLAPTMLLYLGGEPDVVKVVHPGAKPIKESIHRRQTQVKCAGGDRRMTRPKTLTCAYLSAVVVVGLVCQLLVKAWWVDGATSLLIICFVVREGFEALGAEED